MYKFQFHRIDVIQCSLLFQSEFRKEKINSEIGEYGMGDRTAVIEQRGGAKSWGWPRLLHNLLFPKMGKGKPTQRWGWPRILHHLLHSRLLFTKIGGGVKKAEGRHAFSTTFYTPHSYFQKWGGGQKAEGGHAFSTTSYTLHSYFQKWGGGAKSWGCPGILHHLLHSPLLFAKMEGSRKLCVPRLSPPPPTLRTPICKNRGNTFPKFIFRWKAP